MKTQSLFAGRYRIEERIGAGGMGDVFRATDTVLNRSVAIKLLRTDHADDKTVRERFRREAMTAASISHPSLAAVHDYVEDNGLPAIVMELVEGETLAERLRREPLTPAEVGLIGAEACAALGAAHDIGVVHRDIKPSNVMLTPTGGVKVMDFGIARTVSHETLTEAGSVIGTPDYLAPEQVRGEPATPSSDLYSLGAVLYEAATGRRPFTGESSTAVALARLSRDPTPPRAVRPDLSPALANAISHALERDPKDRFDDAAHMRAALIEAPVAPRVQAHAPTQVLPAPAAVTELRAIPQPATAPPAPAIKAKPDGEPPNYSRRRALVAGLALLLIIAAALGTWAATRPKPVLVPKLTGLTEVAAVAKARAAGLRTDIRRVGSATVSAGIVMAQSAPAGSKIGRDSVITLNVSSGPRMVVIPEIDTQDNAQAILEGVGLVLGTVFPQETSDYAPGTVIKTIPAVGKSVPEGTKVSIVVAAAPAPQPKGKDKKRGDH